MNKETQAKIINELNEKLTKVLESKCGDYADNEEVLGNFKRMSLIADVLNLNIYSPEGYALFMVVMKIDRISNLLNSGNLPNNEGIKDSFEDGINYFKLAYCCYIDSGDEEKLNALIDAGMYNIPDVGINLSNL